MNLPVGMPVLSRKNGYNAFTFQNGELLGGSSTHFKSLFCSELQINKKKSQYCDRSAMDDEWQQFIPINTTHSYDLTLCHCHKGSDCNRMANCSGEDLNVFSDRRKGADVTVSGS
jgi:hypothetical protein